MYSRNNDKFEENYYCQDCGVLLYRKGSKNFPDLPLSCYTCMTAKAIRSKSKIISTTEYIADGGVLQNKVLDRVSTRWEVPAYEQQIEDGEGQIVGNVVEVAFEWSEFILEQVFVVVRGSKIRITRLCRTEESFKRAMYGVVSLYGNKASVLILAKTKDGETIELRGVVDEIGRLGNLEVSHVEQ